MTGLTDIQLSEFTELGFVVVSDLVPNSVLEGVERDIAGILSALADEAQRTKALADKFEDDPFDLRLANLRKQLGEGCEIERAVTGKNLRTAGMFALMTCREILDVVDSVIGPEILVHPQFNCQAKFPGEDSSLIPWHQDLSFLDPSAEKTMMVNFWIPLVTPLSRMDASKFCPTVTKEVSNLMEKCQDTPIRGLWKGVFHGESQGPVR